MNVEVPQQNYRVLRQYPSRTPSSDSKKAGYSELLFDAFERVTSMTTLSFPRENSNTTALSWRLVSIPTPTQHLSPWVTLEKDGVQPLSRSLVTESMSWVEISPVISSWYRSTSYTISRSFPAREVTLHISRTSL